MLKKLLLDIKSELITGAGKTKWISLLFGFLALFAGLNIQAYQVAYFKTINNLPSYLYILGGVILLLPPLIDIKLNSSSDNQNPERESIRKNNLELAKVLFILEVFLLISNLLFFWDINFWIKLAIRILLSIAVTYILKYYLEILPKFDFNWFRSPIKIFKYQIDVLKGRYPAAYSMNAGTDWLGIGYAFLNTTFGEIALSIGSLFLTLYSIRGFKATNSPIAFVWMIINALYFIYGIFFAIFN